MRAKTKQANLERAKRLLIEHYEQGVAPVELRKALGVSHSTVHRYLKELGAVEIFPGAERYRYEPTADDVELAKAILAKKGE